MQDERKGPKKSAVYVRSLSIDDLPAVYHLGATLFRAGAYPSLYRTWDEFEVVAFFDSDWDTCFVAEIDEDVVGFVLGTVLEKRRSAWSYGWVVWIGVDPKHARSGVASKLLERVTEEFVELGCRILLADTDPANDKAVGFFTRNGFGHPRKHVYLEKNLARAVDAKKEGKKKQPRAGSRTRERAPAPLPRGVDPGEGKRRS